MSKKTVNVSEQLISSILIGFLLAIIILFIGHLSPKNWKAMPEESDNSSRPLTPGGRSISLGAKVSSCWYECMFGESHEGNCKGQTLQNFGDKSLSVGEIFSASFEHISTILIIGLIASAVIYILKRVNFNVVKE